jgi:fucose permease
LKILKRARNLPVGLSYFAFILIGANDGAFGVLLPSLQAHYGVDKATIGLLFLSAALGYLIGAFNTGLLVEKLGQRLFLMLGAASFLLGVGALSLMPPFILAVIMFLPSGFGIAAIDAGLNAYIAGLPHNTTLLNYLHAFYGAGAWLGPVVASAILAIGWGWHSVYFIWMGVSLVLLIGFRLIFSKRGVSSQRDAVKARGNVLVAALKLRIVWLAALFLLFYVGTEVSLGSWSYTFLLEERHGATLLSGWSVSGYWLGLTLGRLMLGRVAQRVGNKRLIQGCLLGVVIGVLLIWLVPAQGAASFGLALTGFCLGPIFPTTIALMSNLVSARVLPSAIGLLASLGSMGAALFPWLAGNVAQYVGMWSLLPYVIVLTVMMLMLWLSLQRRPQPEQASMNAADK